MRETYTVKEFFEKVINANDVDVITIHDDVMVQQCDNPDSILTVFLDKEVRDYELEFDTDNEVVYLDIYCS